MFTRRSFSPKRELMPMLKIIHVYVSLCDFFMLFFVIGITTPATAPWVLQKLTRIKREALNNTICHQISFSTILYNKGLAVNAWFYCLLHKNFYNISLVALATIAMNEMRKTFTAQSLQQITVNNLDHFIIRENTISCYKGNVGPLIKNKI